MKHKRLLITTLIFFLAANTSHFWMGKIGLWGMPVFLLLVLIFFGLVIALLSQLYSAFEEHFKNKQRNLAIILLAVVLILSFLKPFGIIDFERFESKNVLIALTEGAANCTTTIKLKENGTFREVNVCFGMTENEGKYTFRNDTIYFDNGNRKKDDDCYEFAVIRNSKFAKDDKPYLVRYKNKKDTIGQELFIICNELGR